MPIGVGIVTKQDFIYQALRRCGQMRPGYTPSPELLQDASNEWQILFDGWAAERSMGFSVPDYVYPVTGPGSQSNGNGYQVGPTAADWVGQRPNMIYRANLVMTNVGTQPVYLPIRMISMEEWAGLAIRQIPAINVTSLAYYDPQFPNGVFNVFPPLNGNSIELFTNQQLAVPGGLTDPYSAPPAYMDAIICSLAEALWPLCTHDFMPKKLPFGVLANKAYAARMRVRNVNRDVSTLRNDAPGNRRSGAPFYDPNVTWTGEPY